MIDCSETFIFIMVDFSAFFHNIDHSTLIKDYFINLSDTVLNWYHFYLFKCDQSAYSGKSHFGSNCIQHLVPLSSIITSIFSFMNPSLTSWLAHLEYESFFSFLSKWYANLYLMHPSTLIFFLIVYHILNVLHH